MKNRGNPNHFGLSRVSRKPQHGAALVLALVILFVLTILGVSALRTSSLEQLMSGNVQELTRAFQAADSGVSKSLSPNVMPTDPSKYIDGTTYSFAGLGAVAKLKAPFMLQIAQAPRSDKPTSGFCMTYYDQKVTGTTNVTNARDVLHSGFSKGAPADPSNPDPCS